MNNFNNLQVTEVFHIEFLRAFARKFKPSSYSLKGGVNMRLFFKSIRYSEDLDLDTTTGSTTTLRNSVMNILASPSFLSHLKSFGIDSVRPPDISKAKQTETTQRFKIHLITSAREDIPTKIEFSRRPASGKSAVEHVSDSVLHPYKIPPLLVSHYKADEAVFQKISALSGRKITQARDIFDLHVLSSQITKPILPDKDTVTKACENLFLVEFNQFRDTVLSYLADEDRTAYDDPSVWDEIKLKVNEMICQKHQ
jgi:predicted nucleotidyltransferase component of viral defense system